MHLTAMLAYLIEQADSICEFRIAQVGLQEPEEGQQQALEVGPPLVAGSQQQLGHQVAVTDQLQPGKCKPRHSQWLQHDVIAPSRLTCAALYTDNAWVTGMQVFCTLSSLRCQHMLPDRKGTVQSSPLKRPLCLGTLKTCSCP